MTSPSPPAVTDAPDLIGVGAQSIVDRSKSLGLVWTRRMATVTDGSNAASCMILFDNDTNPVSAVSMMGALGTDTRVYVDMVPPSANFITGIASTTVNPILTAPVNYNAAMAAGTTTSATFVDLPGSPTMTLNKLNLDTRIRYDFHLTLYTTLANTTARLAVLLNGTTDIDICQIFLNVANAHTQVSGTLIYPFAATGAIPIVGRWRRLAGTGTLTTDTNDWFSVTAQEVQ